MNGFNLMITFFYKLANPAKAKAMNLIVGRFSKEFGFGKLYPFAKVATGMLHFKAFFWTFFRLF